MPASPPRVSATRRHPGWGFFLGEELVDLAVQLGRRVQLASPRPEKKSDGDEETAEESDSSGVLVPKPITTAPISTRDSPQRSARPADPEQLPTQGEIGP